MEFEPNKTPFLIIMMKMSSQNHLFISNQKILSAVKRRIICDYFFNFSVSSESLIILTLISVICPGMTDRRGVEVVSPCSTPKRPCAPATVSSHSANNSGLN